jgi:hypothetical protein
MPFRKEPPQGMTKTARVLLRTLLKIRWLLMFLMRDSTTIDALDAESCEKSPTRLVNGVGTVYGLWIFRF